MNLDKFRRLFSKQVLFRLNDLEILSTIEGMNSPAIQHTLNLATSCLRDTGEAYFEVGCFHGSSLYAASRYNDDIPKYACDIKMTDTLKGTMKHIENLTFFEHDFFTLDMEEELNHKVGVFFFDSRHEYEDLINALTKIEPFLADKAIVVIDDIEFNRTYNACRDFFKRPENVDRWTIVHEFWTPDKFISVTRGYPEGWWNGLAIAEFERIPDRPNQLIEWVAMQVYKGNAPYRYRMGNIYPTELKDIHGEEELHVSELSNR
jgi:hypothetical protein